MIKQSIDNIETNLQTIINSETLKTEDKEYLNQIYFLHSDKLDSLCINSLTSLARLGYDVEDALFKKVRDNNYKASDEVLAYMTRKGDMIARDIIAEKYVDFVKGVVTQLSKRGRFNKGYEIEDLIQSGYISFFNAIGDFKIEMNKPFKMFTRYVISRHINSLISKSNNNKQRSLNDSFSYHTPIGSDSDTTFEELLRTEEFLPENHLIKVETFYEIWDSLSEIEKSVLLYYADDHSYKEIGEIVFGNTHDTVSKQTKAVDNTMQRINKKRDEFLEKNEIKFAPY